MKNQLEPIEILNHLDEFYNNAWDKLILFTTVLLGIVGIILPLIISWLQNRNLKLKEENLRKEIESDYKNKLILAKSEILEELQKQFDENIEEFSKRQEKVRSELKGLHFHLQAISTQNSTKGKLTDYIIAAEYYIKAEDFLNLRTMIDSIISEIEKTSKEELDEIKEDSADLEILLDNLKEIDINGSFTGQIRDLNKKLKKIPLKKVE